MGIMDDILDGVSGVVRSTAGNVFDVLDAPRTLMTEGLGRVDYWSEVAKNQMGIGVSDEELARLAMLYEQGGGRGVWEGSTVNEIPGAVPDWLLPDPIVRGLVDIGIDPLTYAGGIGAAGRVIGTAGRARRLAPGASMFDRGLGAAIEAVGTTTLGAGRIMRTPDAVVERGLASRPGRAITGYTGNVLTAATLPLRTPLGALANSTPGMKVRNKWSDLLQYSDQTVLARTQRRASSAIYNYLSGGDDPFGAFQAIGSPSRRADPISTGLQLSQADTAGVPTAAMRNTERMPRYAQQSADWLNSFQGKTARNATYMPGSFAHGIITQGNGVAKDAFAAIRRRLDQSPESTGLVFQNTTFGRRPFYESDEERNKIADTVASMILAEAPVDPRDGVASLRYAVSGVQELKRQLIRENPDLAALWPDIYAEARKRVMGQTDRTLPDPHFASTFPAGATIDADNASDDELIDWGVNYVLAHLQLSRTGGDVNDFKVGGRFHGAPGEKSFSDIFADGGVDQSGLSFASREEVYNSLRQYVGDIPPDFANSLYDLGLERLRQKMIAAVKEVRTIRSQIPGVDGKRGKKGPEIQYGGRLPVNEQEYIDNVIEGESGAGFYDEDVDKLANILGNDPAKIDLMMNLLAITSARTEVSDNVERAVNAYLEIVNNQLDAARRLYPELTDEEFARIPERFANQAFFETHREAIDDMLRGGKIDTQKLATYRGNFDEIMERMAIQEAGLATGQGDLTSRVLANMERANNTSTIDIWESRTSGLSDTPGDQYQSEEMTRKIMSQRSFDDPNYRVRNMTPSDLQQRNWATMKKWAGWETADKSPMVQTIMLLNRWGIEAPESPEAAMAIVRHWQSDTEKFMRDGLRAVEQDGVVILNPRERNFLDVITGKKKTTRPVVLSANLKATQSAKKVEDIDELAGRGVHIMSHRIDIPAGLTPDQAFEKAARDLTILKLMVDSHIEEGWLNTRYIIDSTPADGSLSVDLFYFPTMAERFGGKQQAAGASKEFLSRMQYLVDRVNQGQGDALDKFTRMSQIMNGATMIDNRLNALNKNAGKGWTQLANDVVNVLQTNPEAHSMRVTPSGRIEVVDGFTNPDGNSAWTVAVASAGKGGKLPPKPVGWEKAIKSFMRQHEESWNGEFFDELGFGQYHDEAGWTSFDLNWTGARNVEEAMQVGALTNQAAIWDPTTMDAPAVPYGSGDSNSPINTPEGFRTLMRAVQNARENGTSIIDEGIKLGLPTPAGYTGGEALGITARAFDPVGTTLSAAGVNVPSNYDMANTILESRIGRKATSLLRQNAERATQGETLASEAMRSTEALRLSQMADEYDDLSGAWWLSPEEQQVMQTQFEDGESMASYVDRLRAVVESDYDALAQTGIKWDAGAKKGDVLALTSDPALKDAINRWFELGLRPSFDAESTIIEGVQRRMAKEAGIEFEKKGVYHKAKAIWGEVALASPRYVMANLVSNMMDAMITGHWNFGPGFPDIMRYAVNDLKGRTAEEIAESTKLADLKNIYGIDRIPDLTNSGNRAMIDTVSKGSQFRKLAERLKVSAMARLVEGPMAFATAVDTVFRVSVFRDEMDRMFQESYEELIGKLDAISKNAGVDMLDSNLLPTYNPTELYAYYIDKGFSEGYAKRAANELASVRKKAMNRALEETNRIYLSYDKTNLDEAIGKIIPFHYWASRKVRFYAEEAMRNPALLANYMRAVQGLDRVEKHSGLSGRQKGFLALLGGPTGFTLLMNPDTVMGVIKATGLDNTYTPEGETEIGQVIRLLKQNGVGLYPWIDGIFNMMGTYGDTFEPDILGIRHRAIVAATVNWLRGEGFLGDANRHPGASPYTDLNLRARETISSWVSQFTPDWFSQPVAVNAGGSAGQASLDQVIASRIMAENPNMTNAELAAVMSDPDSEEYQSAFQDAARAGVIGQLLSFSLPVRFRVDENTRDVRTAQNRLIREEAEKAGVQPWELTETTASAEFGAAYKRETGHEFKPGDWNTNQFRNELARATPQARQFVIWEHEYQQIADELAPGVAQRYYAIMNGQWSPQGTDASQLSPDQREMLANRWLDQSGNRQAFEMSRQLQQAYEAQHPQFAQFKQWQTNMRRLQAAYGGSLAEYRRQASATNPYAAHYFESQRQYLQSRGLRDRELAEALDQMTISPSAWYAMAGQPMTVYDQAAGDAGLGDPMGAMAAPFQQGGGYIDPMAQAPSDPFVQQQLMGQPIMTASGQFGQFGGPMEPAPASIDWVTEAQQFRR